MNNDQNSISKREATTNIFDFRLIFILSSIFAEVEEEEDEYEHQLATFGCDIYGILLPKFGFDLWQNVEYAEVMNMKI